MTPLERWLTWLCDAAIVAALLAAPLLWGQWGTARAALGLAVVLCLMALGGLAYLAAALHGRRELTLLRTPLNLPILLLLVVAFASTALASVNRCRSVMQLYQLLAGAMLFALIANQPGAVLRRRIYVSALLLAAVVTSFLGAREYAVQSILNSNPTWRIFGTFLDPNELAGFLELVIPLGAAAFLSSRAPALRIATGFAVALAIMALLLTGSRGGWGSLLVGMLVFGLLAGAAFRRTRLALATGALIVAVAALAALALPTMRVRLLGSLWDPFRVLTWRGTTRMIADHPWLGIGPGAFEFAYPAYAIGGFTTMAHQNYLQTAAEMGIPGLLAFVWMLGAFFWLAARGFRRLRAREDRRVVAGCIGGVAGFCVHSLLQYGWYIGAIEVTVFALFGLTANAAAPSAPAAATPRASRGRRARSGARPLRQAQGKLYRPRGLNAATSIGSRAQVSAPVEEPALLALRRWRLRLSRPAAWVTLVVASGIALLAAAHPLRAYLADKQSEQGRAVEARGNLLTAEVHYRAAVRLAPACGEYHRELGRVLGAPAGMAEVERAMQLEPTHALNHVVIARMYDLVGPWEQAAVHYRRAIELYPTYVGAYRGLAELEARRGRPGTARSLYRKMVKIEHGPLERYKALGQRIETEYAYAHYALGRAALEKGDLARARAELESALHILQERETTGALMVRALQAARGQMLAVDREMAALRARILWRLADVWAQLGDTAKAEALRAEARRFAADVEWLVEQEPPLVQQPPSGDPTHPGRR